MTAKTNSSSPLTLVGPDGQEVTVTHESQLAAFKSNGFVNKQKLVKKSKPKTQESKAVKIPVRVGPITKIKNALTKKKK